MSSQCRLTANPKAVALGGVGRRVAPGGLPPGAPTDPDVRNSRIRFVRSRVRYAIDQE
jgi:hypothetical protein